MRESHPESEMIVLVDEQGRPTGTAEKLPSHHGHTPLHLAFSCYVFNDAGELLVTQRAASKKVWPTVWTNSVCGHPAPGEAMENAIARRLDYELGMAADDIRCVLPDYRYTTPPYNGIIENEFCPVYIARATSVPQPNPAEVDAYRWMAWPDFIAAAEADTSDEYSWWCKDQLRLLKAQPLIAQYAKPVSR
jgi:isopentenyl-diphosphate Delta-isomerase